MQRPRKGLPATNRPAFTRVSVLAPCLLLLSAFSPPGFAQTGSTLPRGLVKPRELPPGWNIHETPHYQIQTECSPEIARDMGKHLEMIMQWYAKIFPFPKRTAGQNKKYPVKLFKGRKEYFRYGGSPGSAAYFRPGDKSERELVGFYNLRESAPETETAHEEKGPEGRPSNPNNPYSDDVEVIKVFYHEAWHQYLHMNVKSVVDFPSWIDEGIGDYFFAARYNQKSKQLELGGMNSWRLPVIKKAVQEGTYEPLPSFMTFDQRAYYANGGQNYAQGWAVVHFLLHSKPQYRNILLRYLKTFEDKHRIPEAYEAAVRGFDMRKVEEEWKEFILGLPDPEIPVIPAKGADEGEGGSGEGE